MRNCENRFPYSKFKYQFENQEIINQCPVSYLDGQENQIYSSYNRLKTMKDLGISTDCQDITLLEVDAYTIIEEEIQRFKNKHIEKQTNKDKKSWKKH